MTKPTKSLCAQRWLRSAWASAQKAWVLSYPLSAQRRFDQTGRMPRLIWVFAGRTGILLVLPCRGSYIQTLSVSPSGSPDRTSNAKPDINEPENDKPTKWPIRQAQHQTCRHPLSLIKTCALFWLAKDPNILQADREDWADWMHVQVDFFIWGLGPANIIPLILSRVTRKVERKR